MAFNDLPRNKRAGVLAMILGAIIVAVMVPMLSIGDPEAVSGRSLVPLGVVGPVLIAMGAVAILAGLVALLWRGEN